MKGNALSLANRWFLLIFVFLTSVLIQSGSLFVLSKSKQHDPNPDYREFYEPVAQNILNGNGITDVGGNLATVYPPGYPAFLAACFFLADFTRIDRFNMVIVFNVFSTALSCCLVFLIGELTFSRRIAFISSMVWISYPFNLWLIKEPNSEIPFILLFYSSVWLFLLATKQRHSVLTFVSGVILALAALVRPIGLFFGVLLALALLFQRGIPRTKKVLYAMLPLIGFVLTVWPWELRVLSETGRLIPLSTNGAASILDGLTFAVKPGPGGDQAAVPQDVLMLMQRIQAHRGTLQSMGGVFDYMAREMTRNPGPVIKLIALKLARSWYGTDAMWHESAIFAIQVLYLTTGLIGVALATRRDGEKNESVVLLLGTILYFWAMTTLAKSILRYMVPAIGFLSIFSAIAINTLIMRWTKRPPCIR